MKKNVQIQLQIIEQGFLPLFNHSDLNINIQIVQILYELKIFYFEYTNRGDNAPSIFNELQNYVKKNMPNMKLGVGTIKNEMDAKVYFNLDAAFMVSPHFNLNIHNFVKKNNIFWIPAAFTPTEIYSLIELNYALIKLFPAINLGYDFIKNIKSVYPNIHCMVSGGIDTAPEILKKWKQAGSSVIGLGSALFNQTLINNNNWKLLKKDIKNIVQTI